MTIRLAGAALAVVMACGCLGVSRARAALIDINGGGEDSMQDDVGFDLTFDSQTLLGDLYVSYSAFNPAAQYDPMAPENLPPVVTDGSVKVNVQGYQQHLTLTASNVDSFVAFTFDFSMAPYALQTATVDVPLQFYEINYPQNLPSLLPVPLPATAPLFGAALIALGAAGYAKRRRLTMPA